MTTGGGSLTETDCVPCNRGHYCNFYDYFTSNNTNVDINAAENNPTYYGVCDTGYICLEGSSIRNPQNNLTGYICPKGYYCLSGAFDK